MKKRSRIVLALSCVALALSGVFALQNIKKSDIKIANDDISVCAVTSGGTSINMQYNPGGSDVVTRSWRYTFNNTSVSRTLAVRLKSDPSLSNMNIKYGYDTEKLDDANNADKKTDTYETQVLAPNESINVYIIAQVSDTSKQATYTDSVRWQMGTAVTTTYIDANGVEHTDTTIKGMEAEDLPTLKPDIDGYEFEGWYLDEEFTKPVTEITGLDTQLYARTPNLPASYLTETADGEGYQIIRSTTDTLEGISTLVIPSTYNGKPVTEIADGDVRASGAFSQSDIITAIIPDTITKIGKYAFIDCVNLINVTIPSSVTTLNQACLAFCPSLEYIEIPSSVTTYGNYILRDCTSLKKVKLPDNITKIPYYMFAACENLIDINIPYGTTSIDDCAFRSCISLETIDLPDSITELGMGVFYDCVNLNNIILPSNLTIMEGYTFNGCTSLTEIHIPESVTYMGDAIFQNCKALEEITGFDKLYLESLGINVFYGCTSLKTFALPINIDTIPNNMFANCNALISIVIPSRITKISIKAFKSCANLTSIEIEGEGVWEITANSDYTEGEVIDITDVETNATNLTTEYVEYYWYNSSMYTQTTGTLPSSWLQFDEDKEEYTVIRGTDTLPNNLTILKMYNNYPIVAIGDEAFKNCTSLFSIQFEEGSLITSIGSYAFNGTGIGSIVIPSGVTSIGRHAFYNCMNLQSAILNNELEIIDEVAFTNCTKLTSITIPSSVTSIGDDAFNNSGLTSIVFEENSKLTSIGYCAFRRTQITTITIPASVTYIGGYAFANCSKLESIIFEDASNWSKTALKGDYSNLIAVDVTTPTQNAEWFKSSTDNGYTEYYWYKEEVAE